MTNKEYTVQRGDSLSGIIVKFYGSFTQEHLDAVVKENNISDPSKTSVGMKLKIPGNWVPEMDVSVRTDASITMLVTKTEPSTTPSTPVIPLGDPTELSKPLPQGEYWKELFPKNLIVLHFTAGYTWESAHSTFLKSGRVATPFVVDAKGPVHIVKLFDEKYWAYHLGIKQYANNWANDKRSIGIEIVNIGPVWFKGGWWHDYTGKQWSPEYVVQGKNRDAGGGVKFPDAQMDAVCDLCNWLLDKWNIPRQIPKDKMSYQLPQIGNFKGVATHQMFRQDKYDLGTSFAFDVLIKKCGLKEVAL